MKLFLTTAIWVAIQVTCIAQGHKNWITPGHYLERDSITRNSYTLIFINKDPTFKKQRNALKEKLIGTFFKVYPEEAAEFNLHTLRKVTFIIDPDYDGVAATAFGVVHFNPRYLLQYPLDVDVVTHEVMHIIQAYPDNAGPSWLTEGIADFARYKFGVANKEANWTLPEYQNGQNYTDSYRITARFLLFLENKVKPGIVKQIDQRLRNASYNKDTWQQLTGNSIDELWSAYKEDPTI